MKNLVLIVLSLSCSFVFSQTNRTDGNGSGMSQALTVAATSSNLSNYGAPTFYNPNREVRGSVYLFDGWSNNAIIYTADRKFSVPNMNLNLERNTFESKFSKDSLFSFNFNNIDRFVINNKVFKSFYHEGENRVFQEVYNGNGLLLLKSVKLKLIKGSSNPMLNRSSDKYVQKSYYYVKEDSNINPLKLKKKALLKYVNDEDQVKKILAYVKKQ